MCLNLEVNPAFSCSSYKQLSGFFLLYTLLCNLFAVMPVLCSILFCSAVSPLIFSQPLRKHVLQEVCSPKSCKWKKKVLGTTVESRIEALRYILISILSL